MSFWSEFFPWYIDEHYHSGLAMFTPAMVHYGTAKAVQQQRQHALDVAYAIHPERFVKAPPTHRGVPSSVWINPPQQQPDPAEETPNREEEPVITPSRQANHARRDTNSVTQLSQNH